MPANIVLLIAPGVEPASLSPQQKRFNTRIRQIEQARQKLLDWELHGLAHRRAYAETLQPLQDALTAGRRAWLLALDVALERPGWSKADRETLTNVLLQAAGETLDSGEGDDELKALFDKHSDIGFDEIQHRQILSMKDMAEAMTGLDLGDDDGLDTDEALFERMQQSLGEQAEAEAAARASKSTCSRKTPAQQRREDEDKQATQSVREVYRKLASALHPDREPDPTQRDAKTVLMQRVNHAYERNDLLALLELQLQIEQIDASHIANAGEERLKYYNKVLGEQLEELKLEIERVEMTFCMEFGLPPDARVNPRKLGDYVRDTKRAWERELAAQHDELRMLDDLAATNRWLKRERASWGCGGPGVDLY